MTKFIKTQTDPQTLEHLHFLAGVIVILPFVTADCERLFSKLVYIKIENRNRLENILKGLLHDATPIEEGTLHILALAGKVGCT